MRESKSLMPKIIVILHDGQVSVQVEGELEPDTEIEVRDYSLPDDWMGNRDTDEDGDDFEFYRFDSKGQQK